jgi:hypothetical protein
MNRLVAAIFTLVALVLFGGLLLLRYPIGAVQSPGMADGQKISLPLWLIARAADMDIDARIPLAKFKQSKPTWLCGSAPGEKVLMAFTSHREANQFVVEHFEKPQDYINAELTAEELILVLDAADPPLTAVRINDKSNAPIAPFREWLQGQLGDKPIRFTVPRRMRST